MIDIFLIKINYMNLTNYPSKNNYKNIFSKVLLSLKYGQI